MNWNGARHRNLFSGECARKATSRRRDAPMGENEEMTALEKGVEGWRQGEAHPAERRNGIMDGS